MSSFTISFYCTCHTNKCLFQNLKTVKKLLKLSQKRQKYEWHFLLLLTSSCESYFHAMLAVTCCVIINFVYPCCHSLLSFENYSVRCTWPARTNSVICILRNGSWRLSTFFATNLIYKRVGRKILLLIRQQDLTALNSNSHAIWTTGLFVVPAFTVKSSRKFECWIAIPPKLLPSGFRNGR